MLEKEYKWEQQSNPIFPGCTILKIDNELYDIDNIWTDCQIAYVVKRIQNDKEYAEKVKLKNLYDSKDYEYIIKHLKERMCV